MATYVIDGNLVTPACWWKSVEAISLGDGPIEVGSLALSLAAAPATVAGAAGEHNDGSAGRITADPALG